MRQPRVLLVEDRADIFELYADMLRTSGYEVLGATDGEVAIDRAQRFMPDVIVMDLGLPKLDGCEATRRLKSDSRTQHIPILMVSGYVQPEVMTRARQSGCDAFFVKPLALDHLAAEVRARLPAALAERPLVLIVEDDDDVRAALAQVLLVEGFMTAEARHGLEALERLRMGPLPRLILLDLMMPVMDGWAFRDAQRANPDWAGIPTVILERRQLFFPIDDN